MNEAIGVLDWLIKILEAQHVLLLFSLLTIGYVIGRLSFKGFSLGPVAGVLFAGILFGHEGLRLSDDAQALGFALFIFSRPVFSISMYFFNHLCIILCAENFLMTLEDFFFIILIFFVLFVVSLT